MTAERAVRNFWVEAFSQKPILSRHSAYRACSEIGLTPAVPASELAEQPSGHIALHPSATTRIPLPQLRGIDHAQLKFCGPFLLHPDIGTTPPDFPNSCTSPPLTLTCLSDALCLPDQVVLARDQGSGVPRGDWAILDASFTSVVERDDHPEIIRLANQTFRTKRSVADFEPLTGPYPFLDCQHRAHFGHFLVDIMSMTWAYQAAQKLGFNGLRVLTTAKLARFMMPLFEAMGISHGAIVPLRRPIRCERLLIATKCFLTQGYTSPVAIATWRQIRDVLDGGTGPERVYFSRSRNSNRTLRNEREVETIFAARGFHIVHPETLPIREQVTQWANVRFAAGSAGSNMFGLAFQRRLQRSLLLNSPNLVQFSELMLQAGHESATTMYVGRATGTDPHAPWSVDVADLERVVDCWLG